MKTWEEFYQEWTLEECINSAAEALTGAGIEFERAGGKLKVAEDDIEKARSVVKAKASTPDDVKFITS